MKNGTKGASLSGLSEKFSSQAIKSAIDSARDEARIFIEKGDSIREAHKCGRRNSSVALASEYEFMAGMALAGSGQGRQSISPARESVESTEGKAVHFYGGNFVAALDILSDSLKSLKQRFHKR